MFGPWYVSFAGTNQEPYDDLRMGEVGQEEIASLKHRIGRLFSF